MAGIAGVAWPDVAWRRRCCAKFPTWWPQMRRARASLSQCGYNTALDLVVSGVAALVAPYETATENEQRGRAERLASLGAMQCLPRDALHPGALAAAIERLLDFQPRPAALALDGAQRSAAILRVLIESPRSCP